MQLEQAIAAIQRRVRSPRVTNLTYLRFPVVYTPVDPARQVAQTLGVEPISMMGLLVERFGDRWDRLVNAERDGQLETVGKTLEQDLMGSVKSLSCAVVCDTEVLYAFPGLNPTALLYPHSEDRVIVVSVKASRVAGGLRLLEDGPVYPVDNCTVVKIDP